MHWRELNENHLNVWVQFASAAIGSGRAHANECVTAAHSAKLADAMMLEYLLREQFVDRAKSPPPASPAQPATE